MSTAILDDTNHSYPCYCPECPVVPAYDPTLDDWRHKELWKLMLVTVGQREEADIADNGWHSVWCVDCEQCSEPFQGKLEDFAAMLFETGWAVNSLDHNTAICKTCSNAEDESHYAEQYRTGSGGIL